jgi:hypothetical protein
VAASVGPFVLARTAQGYRFALLNTSLNILGLVASYPTDQVNLRRRFFTFSAGGPLATALLLILTIIIRANTQPNPPLTNSAHWVIRSFADTGFYVSLFLFLTNMLPTKWISTDGHKLVKLAQGGQLSEGVIANMLLVRDSVSGQLPRDWNPVLISQMTALNDSSLEAVISNYFA